MLVFVVNFLIKINEISSSDGGDFTSCEMNEKNMLLFLFYFNELFLPVY